MWKCIQWEERVKLGQEILADTCELKISLKV
jgi:hypothetical protein